MAFRVLERDIAQIRGDVAGIKADVELLQDPKALKQWLKTYKIVRRSAAELDPFFGMP